MTHAFALAPNFAVPLAQPPACIERLPFHADPVLAAIERHADAWAIYQTAHDGEASERADDETFAALDHLLATPCASRAGAFALLAHLRWWLAEEAPNADAYAASWPIAEAREAELTLLLGAEAVRRISLALPLGRLPSWPNAPALPVPATIEAGPVPAPALVRLGRAVVRAGDVLAALVLIVGGSALVGLATLL